MSQVSKRPLRLVQLTDCHLFADASGSLSGMNTQQSLEQVLQLMAQQPLVDAIIVSGDLAQHANVEVYRWLADRLSEFSLPVYWLPGNHDDASMMRSVVADGAGPEALAPCLLELGDWSLILLDTSVTGESHGYLTAADIEFLQQALNQAKAEHVLVALHHHPLAVNSQWMDRLMLQNAAELFAITDADSRVGCMIYGHVHQSVDEVRKGYHRGVRMLACPSTCVQFKPGAANFTLDGQAPGYRQLTLYADGKISTEVRRLGLN